jgi:hypothetical protein
VKPQHVELRIEELVLHGFPHVDRHCVSDAVEHELSCLLAEHGIPPLLTQKGEIGYLDVGAFTLKPISRPETVGAQAARAVYGGLDT